MSLTGVLAVTGGFTVAFLVWRVWCVIREFVWSLFWTEDLRRFGQWAGNVKEHVFYFMSLFGWGGFLMFSVLSLVSNSAVTWILDCRDCWKEDTRFSSVVTGATSGIGKAYADELAQRGLDVVLVSRSNDKLQAVAKEIEERFRRKTRTIQVDFTEGHSIYPVIAKGLQGLEIGILVNNVGMTYSEGLDFFLDVPGAEKKITEIINCNVLSVPQMTRLVLPDMVKRGRGLIINLSSYIASRPHPLLALYSSSKSFVSFFSQCLQTEYKSKGIIVQCVAPLMVASNMTKRVKFSSIVKSAPSFVREALNAVGHSTYTRGCLAHALQYMLVRTLLPDWLLLSQYLIRKQHVFEKLQSKD